MSVTPEMIEEVAEWVRERDGLLDSEVAVVLMQHATDMKALAAAEFGPDAALASALRTAYHDDGEVHYAKYSSVPGQWLRMAAAARAHVAGEERARFARVDAEPRVFHQGEYIPADVSVLTDAVGDTILRDGAGKWRYTHVSGLRLTQSPTWFEEPLRGNEPFTEVLS